MRAGSPAARPLHAGFLVDSQFATLEPPDGEPNVIVIPADADLGARSPSSPRSSKGAEASSDGPAVAGLPLPFGAGGANLGLNDRRRKWGERAMFYGQIEGTDFVVLDKRFSELFAGHIRVDRLWTGAVWSEGPAWFAAGRYLIWSDIPNNRMLRYDDASGHVSVFRQPSNNSNGNTVDNQGRLVTCEHLMRRVTRTEIDGSITVLADKWQGKRLNSPNDVVVKSDDSIWFTDPSYGIDSDNEGDRASPEIDGCHVYRVDPKTGDVARIIDDMVRPNGLAFSPDEKLLYVADTGAPRHIRRIRRVARRQKRQGRRGVRGLHRRSVRRLSRRPGWAGLDEPAEGVHCFDPDGTLIGKILIPEIVANVTFGGAKRNRLFICGTTSLYAALLMTNGSKLG